jgi:integrase
MTYSNDAADLPERAGPAQARGLTAQAVAKAKPAATAYRMTDTRGLYLWVKPTGGKVWRTNYIIAGRKRLLTLGEFPRMSLAEARAARAQVKIDVRAGANPTTERSAARSERIARNGRTFEVMATAWHAHMARTEWSADYAAEVMRRLARHAFPAFGDRPIDTITRNDIFALLERRAFGATGEGGTRSGAHLLRQNLRQCFEHWLTLDLIPANPADRLAKAFPRVIVGPQPAALTIEGARAVLAAIDATRADLATKLLIRFQALTCVRPTEARAAVWSEIDGAMWSIPAERMKGVRGHKVGHDVPLSRQALDVLAVARAVLADGGPYVFPARHRGGHRPLSACAPRELMRTTLGPREHVPHGWRATFSTVMNERHPDADRVFDRMLAHRRGGVEARYNRARYLAHARERAQEWADLLLDGAASAYALAGLPEPAAADVIAFPGSDLERAA